MERAHHVSIGNRAVGNDLPLALIAGPCAIESRAHALATATELAAITEARGMVLIYKSSFDKANRTSGASFRGIGMAEGLAVLAAVRETVGCPVLTDVHEPAQCAAVAEVVDVLQIPAFLCRQTDLLLATGRAAKAHGCAVNIKKGQFLSPEEMAGPIQKAQEAGCDNLLLTERGTFFGYHRLVNDFIGLGDLLELGPPICFDVTHSTQLPGSGAQTGGRPERAPLLARAATAAGAHALFIETHPDPKNAKSDGSTVLPLDTASAVIAQAAAIRQALESPKNQ